MSRRRRKRKINYGRLVIFLLLALAGLSFLYSFIEQTIIISKNNYEKELLEQEKSEIEKEIESLGIEIQRSDDPDFIEDLARKKLNMVYPDDIIYVDESTEALDQLEQDTESNSESRD